MTWFWLALSFAILSSFSTLIYKTILKKADEYLVAWVSSLLIAPGVFLIVLIFYQIPQVNLTFFLVTAASALLNVEAVIFSYRALKISEVSLIAPMSAFNPVFTTFISWLVLKETPSFQGIMGIIIIVVGAYLLKVNFAQKELLAPFIKLFSHQGVLLALLSSFIWAITPIFEKIAIFHTQPQVPPFASLFGNLFLMAALLPLVFLKSKKPFVQIKNNLKPFLLVGLMGSLAAVAAFNAFSLMNLGYVTAVFKLSMIFNVFLAYLFFKEGEIKTRILGSTVMFIGVLLIVL